MSMWTDLSTSSGARLQVLGRRDAHQHARARAGLLVRNNVSQDGVLIIAALTRCDRALNSFGLLPKRARMSVKQAMALVDVRDDPEGARIRVRRSPGSYVRPAGGGGGFCARCSSDRATGPQFGLLQSCADHAVLQPARFQNSREKVKLCALVSVSTYTRTDTMKLRLGKLHGVESHLRYA